MTMYVIKVQGMGNFVHDILVSFYMYYQLGI